MATPQKITLEPESEAITLSAPNNKVTTRVQLHTDGKVGGATRTVALAGQTDLEKPENATDDWKPDFPKSVPVDGKEAAFILAHQVDSLALMGVEVARGA